MYIIVNKINLTTINCELLDGKEELSFEISRPFAYTREILATCKLPCFSHNIGYCKTVKQAEDMIAKYYKDNYDKLLQLKNLGNIRCELSRKITDGELLDLSRAIDERITGKFPLVDIKCIRDTEYELAKAYKKRAESYNCDLVPAEMLG